MGPAADSSDPRYRLTAAQALTTMIEIIAAAIGAGIGIAASGVGNFVRRDTDAAIAVVRLTAAVEHIAEQVSLMREEIKEDRQELYPRLNAIEQRLVHLEAKQ